MFGKSVIFIVLTWQLTIGIAFKSGDLRFDLTDVTLMMCWNIGLVFKERCLNVLLYFIIVSCSFACGVLVCICIREFVSVLTEQGDWKSIWIELSLMLLLLHIWILATFDGCFSVGCSGDSFLEAESSDEIFLGFEKKNQIHVRFYDFK